MKLFSWNINGIRASINKGELAAFADKYQPDILCLQEVKAKKEQVELPKTDYEVAWASAKKPGYSGVAIFSKIKPRRVFAGFLEPVMSQFSPDDYIDDFGDITDEGRLLTAEFKGFFLVNVYTPNSKGDLGRLGIRANFWDKAFLAHIKQLEKTKPVIICGDLNVAHQEIDLARPKQNVGKHGFTTEERAGFDAFVAADLIDSYRHLHPNETKESYTWWSHWGNARANNVGWRIDYFLTSNELRVKIKSAGACQEVVGSDHCPIYLEVLV